MIDPDAHFPPEQTSLPIHCWLKITWIVYMRDFKTILLTQWLSLYKHMRSNEDLQLVTECSYLRH